MEVDKSNEKKLTWEYKEQVAILSRLAKISYTEKLIFEKRFKKRDSVT